MIFINIDSCWFIFLISSYALCLSQWDPSKLEFVSDGMVDSYFSIVDDEGWEDLKLPARSNLRVCHCKALMHEGEKRGNCCTF